MARSITNPSHACLSGGGGEGKTLSASPSKSSQRFRNPPLTSRAVKDSSNQARVLAASIHKNGFGTTIQLFFVFTSNEPGQLNNSVTLGIRFPTARCPAFVTKLRNSSSTQRILNGSAEAGSIIAEASPSTEASPLSCMACDVPSSSCF